MINISMIYDKYSPYIYNFGDYITNIFFEKLTNNKIIKQNIYLYKQNINYITIGSILRLCNNNSIIIGTGFISQTDYLGKGEWNGENNKVYQIPNKILSIRGPKSRQKLLDMNIKCPEMYGDPLILFPLIYNKKVEIMYDIGFIPHYIDQHNKNYNNFVNKHIEKYKIHKINILCGDNYEKFIDDINKCEYIISSSLHGIIMGIVYKKKTIFVNFSDNVYGSNFKFYDFFESLDIKYKIPNLNDDEILNKYIKVNNDNLIQIGKDIINVIPFMEENRKNELINNWNNYFS